MTSRTLTAAALCLLLAGPPAVARADAPPIPAGSEPIVGADYAEARKIAARRKVPLLIEFYADW